MTPSKLNTVIELSDSPCHDLAIAKPNVIIKQIVLASFLKISSSALIFKTEILQGVKKTGL